MPSEKDWLPVSFLRKNDEHRTSRCCLPYAKESEEEAATSCSCAPPSLSILPRDKTGAAG